MEKIVLKAKNIKWVVDVEDILLHFEDLTDKSRAEFLEISEEKFSKMHRGEISDYLYEMKKKNENVFCELFSLPDEVIINDLSLDKDKISDWLYDEFNFPNKGFDIELNISKKELDSYLEYLYDEQEKIEHIVHMVRAGQIKTKKKVWNIPVEWALSSTIKIEADSLEDAIRTVRKNSWKYHDVKGEYINNSYSIVGDSGQSANILAEELEFCNLE